MNRLKSYGVCVVADALKGFNAMNGSIQPVVPGKCICGCAVTVRLHPGDNLLLHKAIESAQPGDILVLDTNSSYRRAVIGGIMSGAAFGKGIGGLVVDGAVRDVEGVSGMVTAMGGSVTDLVHNKKNAQKGAKGVKIDMTGAALVLDIYLTVEYGHPIPTVAENAQKAVIGAVEAMTGCSVEAVNIHVGGVTLA